MKKVSRLFFLTVLVATILFGACKKDKEDSTTETDPGVFSGSIAIYSSANDTTLKNFLEGDYHTISGSLMLYTSDAIDYGKYLVNLKKVGGSVKLYKIPNADLSFIKTVTRISSTLQISACPNLVSLEGVNNLDTLGNLFIDQNPKIKNLKGLEKVKTITDLTVYASPAFESFEGLSRLTIVNFD